MKKLMIRITIILIILLIVLFIFAKKTENVRKELELNKIIEEYQDNGFSMKDCTIK